MDAVLVIDDYAVNDVSEYASIPIRFTVSKRMRVTETSGCIDLNPEPVTPWEKNYDSLKCETPFAWRKNWDTSNWRLWIARLGDIPIGGAVVAWDTPGLEMLSIRPDSSCLWDLRVVPEYRRQGIGQALFRRAASWSAAQGAKVMIVETQDINVPACHFYESNGCTLIGLNEYAYSPDLDETQLIWELPLVVSESLVNE
ncbi:MAG TPA: GNAT family N-acetyltransferase [Capsulimonadaceae bacterium]|jgi:ribosomal protein S18 acetylase RimI-like enzyme